MNGGVIATLTVNGDIVSNGGDFVKIEGTCEVPIPVNDCVEGTENLVTITGSVKIQNTANGVKVHFADIGANSQFYKNENSYSIVQSSIDGNVQVKDNSIENEEGVYHNFSGNTITGNLQCSGNDPAPEAVGFGLNDVGGKAQGQCSGLEIPPP